MIKVTDIVLDLIESDSLAKEALNEGLLNLSAYAQKIHSQVENATKKPVQKGTIVVALSRINKSSPNTPSLNPKVKLKGIDIKSSLITLTYKKTVDMQRKIANLNPFTFAVNELFATIEGVENISVIASERIKSEIIKNLGTPKTIAENLEAITVIIDKEFIGIPNVLHSLLASFASKKLSLVEIFSSSSEITFVVKKEHTQSLYTALSIFQAK